VLELGNIADVLSGVPVRETKDGSAHFMRLSDFSDLKAGRTPILVAGEAPALARALVIQEGDLVVAARGAATDVCVASYSVFGAYVSLDIYLVRPDRARVNSQYLSAFLSIPATQALLAGGKQGSSLARLPKDALEKVEVPLPPMHVQELIAALALSVEEEDKLLKKLTSLNSILGRETVARAIRAAGTQQYLTRSIR
jgi:hypothetical protein